MKYLTDTLIALGYIAVGLVLLILALLVMGLLASYPQFILVPLILAVAYFVGYVVVKRDLPPWLY